MLRNAKQRQITVVFATFVAPGLEWKPRGPHSCVDEIIFLFWVGATDGRKNVEYQHCWRAQS